jgi:hypothetical protein
MIRVVGLQVNPRPLLRLNNEDIEDLNGTRAKAGALVGWVGGEG